MTEDNKFHLDRWVEFRRKLPYGVIKTGFILSPDDSLLLLPDPEQIKWIEQGFDYLDAGSSYREVGEWLSQKIKKSVTHQTIANLYNTYRKPFLTGKTKKRKGPKRTKTTIELANANRKITQAIKTKERLEQKALNRKLAIAKRTKGQLSPEDYDIPPVPLNEREKKEVKEVVFKDAPAAVNILFKPNPGPQTEFLRSTESEILYGGGAGGGKSYAMLADPMRFFDNGNFVGLLLRRTNDELRELKRESQKLYPKLFGAKWREKDSMWKFPSGAEFWMSYLDRDDDVLRYQGQSFCWIGIDELTQYPSAYAWNYLKSRLRTTDPKLQPYLRMRATCNPGGPGHQWVKKMFVDPAPYGVAFDALDEDGDVLTYPKNDPRHGEPLFKRKFIPARVSDNPYLNDSGDYERGLMGLPEDQRRKLLEGDWTVVEGAAFPEFSQKVHVKEPFTIPSDWRRFRACDYGYSDAAAVLWFAVDPTYDQLVVYRELYVKQKTGKDLAIMIKNIERGEKISYGVIDHNVYFTRGQVGPTIVEEMIAEGTRWMKADKGPSSRTAGKNRLHELLKVDPQTNQPGIVFFNTCRQILSDLPSLPTDPDGVDDIDSRFKNDHTYDALRYGIMSRPRSHVWDTQMGKVWTPSDKRFGY